jgi:4-diphosphocytidyl-2-C-methyl-D-erythritol kinase
VAVHHPEIGRIARALRGAGAAYAAMSGSGSAVFALFASQTAARAAAGMLRSSSRRIIVTRTLNRQRHDVMTKPH